MDNEPRTAVAFLSVSGCADRMLSQSDIEA
jgi:hypothetical protein